MSMFVPVNYEGRIRKIRKAMAERALTALIVTRAASIYYTAGCFFIVYRPGAAVVIPADGEVTIVARAVDYGRLQTETWIRDVRPWVGWATNALPETTFEQAIADALKSSKSAKGKIGFEFGMEQEPGRLRAENLSPHLSQAELVDASEILDQIMMRKEPEEILLLRQAAAIADAGVAAAVEAVEPGMRETELAGHVEFAMRHAGAEWFMAPTTVASGFRSAYIYGGEPNAASEKVIQRGDIIHIDCTPVYKLYLGDHIGMVCVGEPNKEQAALATAVYGIGEEYLTKFRAGAVVSELDRFAREAKKKSGYDYDCWISGHGMGCPPRTPPYFTPKDKTVLEPDMVLALIVQVHPPGVGGMSLEFAVHITDGDPIPLNKTPKRLLVAND